MNGLTGLAVRNLVFLDEAGFQHALYDTRGWAPVGETPMVIAPTRGKNVTAIGAITVDGPLALCLQAGYMNKEDFLWYLENVLGPELHEGALVVMDNLRSHTSIEAAEVLARFGATPLFLPPYSPEYNPIELCWARMKAWFRHQPLAKGMDALFTKATSAWDLLTAEFCEAVVRHCGFHVEST